jgi:Tfp pilus assembly protein PilF
MRRALADLKMGQYDACLTKLDKILETDPHNAQAHYLKAVVYVSTRHFSQAAVAYRSAIEYSLDPQLSALAQKGLAKLGH